VSSYALASDVCIALTNFHVKNHPLRTTDRELYLQILSNYEKKGKEKIEEQKKKYANRQAVRAAQNV